jgi:hypothetical protein
MITYMYHNAVSIPSRNDLLTRFREAADGSFIPGIGDAYFHQDVNTRQFLKMKQSIGKIHDFIATGYANTVGWAHADTGDTMTSVMIGGLRTVQNGDFEVYCGDLIQWYWPFEKGCFHNTGKRKPLCQPFHNQDPSRTDGSDGEWSNSRDVSIRKRYYDREYGQTPDHPKLVAYIKPFKRDDQDPRLYDWYRVFAVAISSARPHEKVDIRISRQSL